MPPFSYARAALEHWRVPFESIPTSDVQEKQEADLLANFNGVRVLIEEKTKEDDPVYLATRAAELAACQSHTATLPIRRDETLAGLVRDASHQLRSSSDKPHDFRLIWFTATGAQAVGKYRQFMATLYGTTNIIEKNASNVRCCYYFQHADFFRRLKVIDGAVVAHTEGNSIKARLCLNSLSPRFQTLRTSSVLEPFGTAVEDPEALETEGTAFVLDTALDRKQEGPLLIYLQQKYGTGPLMSIEMVYISAASLMSKDEA